MSLGHYSVKHSVICEAEIEKKYAKIIRRSCISTGVIPYTPSGKQTQVHDVKLL